ncbi:glutathione S-transferase [Labrys miyagiensis]|uniref:Glutathione S-transferase n=1 Tax=Labrys miyagiensis TaxID=346912 RepID=A0ABQ6CL17_9HYPH|nr:glutathione S-transferase family protein [Labrys miyagiensis]GLS20520.1 glutathione S-transferase [Labrys miyagiensis]
MKLYYCETLSPRKACAVARHLGSPVEFVRVDLPHGEHRQAPFLAINPNGRVPVLQDGDWSLWEANAIMCHLSDLAGADLWPHDRRQIEVMRWLSWDSQHFTRHTGTLWFEHVVKPHIGMGEPDEATVAAALAETRRSARLLDDHLDGRSHVVGDSLSIADFALASALPDARAARIPLDDYPNIRRWHDRLNEFEAWRQPFPARPPAVAA